MHTISQSIIESLGATLLHSLWQGLLIVLVLSFLLKVFKNKSPQFKYHLSCVSLLALVTWMSSTFFSHFNRNIYQHSDTYIPIDNSPSELINGNIMEALNWQQNLETYFTSFIELYSSELVFIWLMGVLLFGIKWTGAFYYTFSLKKNNTAIVPLKWQNKIKQLSYNLGIDKKINILESTKIDVPMVIGYLKPVILIPTSAFTGFTADQLEAVIVHELAHIKNNDFLINMILSALEVVLFYHPAYWFIYKIIMQERENHCDDIAVAHIGNPRLYAETLFNMEKIRQQHSLAMALQGNKNQLLERIKRICIAPNQQYKGGINKSGMAMGFLFILAIISLAKVPLDAKENILIPLTEEIKEAFINPINANDLEEEKELIIEEENSETNFHNNHENSITVIGEHHDGDFHTTHSSLANHNKNYVPSPYNSSVLTEKKYMQTKAIHPILENSYEKHIPSLSNSILNHTITSDSIPDSEKITLTIVSKLEKDGNVSLVYYKEGKVTKRIFLQKKRARLKLNGIKQELGNHTFKLRKNDTFSIHGTMEISVISDDESSIKGDKILYDNSTLFNEGDETETLLSENSNVRVIEKSNGDFLIQERDENGKLLSEKIFNDSDEEEMSIYEDKIERIHQQVEKEHHKMEQLHQQLEIEHEENMERHEKDMERHEKDMERHEKNNEKKHKEDMKRHEEDMERHEEDMRRHEENRERSEARKERMEEFHQVLIDELLKDGLIKNKKKVDFSITKGKIKIKGKRIDDKYHAKYLKLCEKFIGSKITDDYAYRFKIF